MVTCEQISDICRHFSKIPAYDILVRFFGYSIGQTLVISTSAKFLSFSGHILTTVWHQARINRRKRELLSSLPMNPGINNGKKSVKNEKFFEQNVKILNI